MQYDTIVSSIIKIMETRNSQEQTNNISFTGLQTTQPKREKSQFKHDGIMLIEKCLEMDTTHFT